MANGIKRRNMWLQVLWTVLTLGGYSVYWYHVTNEEMANYLKRDEPLALWTVLLFVPFGFFYSYYKEGELYEALTQGQVNRWIIFVLWIAFAPAVWFMIQTKLNELATTPAPLPEA